MSVPEISPFHDDTVPADKLFGTTSFVEHDRYWIPAARTSTQRFYLDFLLVPHSFREFLWAKYLRFFSRFSDPYFERQLENRRTGMAKLVPPIPSTLARFLTEEDLTEVPPLILQDYATSKRENCLLFLFKGNEATPHRVLKISNRWGALGAPKDIVKAQTHLNEDGTLIASQLLRWIQRDDGLNYLIETFVEGPSIYFEMRNSWHPSSLAAHHFRQAGRCLTSFQRRLMTQRALLDASLIDQAVLSPLARIDKLLELEKDEIQMLDYVRRLSASLEGGEEIPLTASHGDFWPRNIILGPSRVGLIDWERFERDTTPFRDLFLFPTSYALCFPWKLAKWAKPEATFRAGLFEKSWLSGIIHRYFSDYCKTMEISPKLLEIFFPVFLAGQVLEEKTRTGGSHELSPWRTLFRQYAHSGGSVCFGSSTH